MTRNLTFAETISAEAAELAKDPELELYCPEDRVAVVSKLNAGLLDQLFTDFRAVKWDHGVIYLTLELSQCSWVLASYFIRPSSVPQWTTKRKRRCRIELTSIRTTGNHSILGAFGCTISAIMEQGKGKASRSLLSRHNNGLFKKLRRY